MKRRLGETDNIFFVLGLVALALVGASVLLYVCSGFNVLNIKYPCVFYNVTGLYCPGCGGTRSVKALLRGDLITSFLDYPPVIYAVVIFIIFMVRCFYIIYIRKSDEGIKDGAMLPYMYVGIGMALVQWIAKLIAQIGFNYTWIK